VGTWKTLYKMRNIKVGKLVGTDALGNQYFENYKDYASGHRWVVYEGDKPFYDVDASTVPPEWHSWLHYVTDVPPTDTTVGNTAVPVALTAGSSAPYKRSLGGVINAHAPANVSNVKSRGWGLGNGLTNGSEPHERGAWTQPGHPLDKRNVPIRAAAVRARAARLGFSLKDTPLTLLAKKAAREGLSIEDYATYVDPESATHMLIKVSDGHISPEEARSLAAGQDGQGAELLVEGAAGLPENPVARAHAVRLALGGEPGLVQFTGDQRLRPLMATSENAGSLAAAIKARLTPSEMAALAGDVEAAEFDVLRYSTIISNYQHIRTKEAQVGVEKATALRDAAAAKVRVMDVHAGMRCSSSHFTLTPHLPSPPPSHQAASIKAARSKVALIEAEFDAKGFAMAAECTEAILAEAREEALEFEKEESQLR
jgi:NADH:ubiquinone oxidoreductase subunit